MDPSASAPPSTPPAAADPPTTVDRQGLRDPWVRPGLALLAIATVLAVLLYRAAPQSAAEVGSSALVAVAPDAFTPHLSRARERRDAGMRARTAGDTAGAIAALAEGEEEAMAARQRASDSTQTRAAAELWAGVVLDRAELMLSAGAGPWYRGDNDQVLQEALAAVNRAQEAPLEPATKARAAALDERIRRQLRPGPLEWLPPMTWTAAQRAVAASLLFLVSAVLAGVVLVEHGVEYHLFGIVEGLFALLLGYLLVLRGAWPSPSGVCGWIVVVYGTVATAQVLEFLFPPPGLVQWVVVAGVAITAWSVFSAGTPRRLVASLASLAVVLALVRYSVIPVLWTHLGPAQGTALGLGNLAEGARRVFADWHPVRPAGELVGFVAVCCWALATRLVWSPTRGSEADTGP